VVTNFSPGETVDVLLIDRTLHMLPEEATRVSVLESLIRAVGRGGWVLLLDEPSNMGAFERVLLGQAPPWSLCYQGTPRASLRPVTGTMFTQRPD